MSIQEQIGNLNEVLHDVEKKHPGIFGDYEKVERNLDNFMLVVQILSQ